VLTGSREQRIVSAGHDQLSTWNILGEFRRQDVRQWIEQLVGQGFLCKEGEYQIVRVTDEGRRLLSGQVTPTLLRPAKATRASTSAAAGDSWEGVDHELFDTLRQLRREVATARSVPAYIVFSDATLRDMARRRPSSVERLLEVNGVGEKKAADFGEQFVQCIADYCRQNGVTMNIAADAKASSRQSPPPTLSASAVQAFPLFEEGLSVEQAAERLGRAVSTTNGYLDAYVRQRKITDVSPWVPHGELEEIEAAAEQVGGQRLKPIYDALGGRIPYERIRIALVCLANRTADE
jgi:ATP-dependent DNA helicase RecQ